MELRIDDAVALLSRTPAALTALLAGLKPEWADANDGDGTWSAFDVSDISSTESAPTGSRDFN